MFTHRIKAAIKAGLLFGFLAGLASLAASLAGAIPELPAAGLVSPAIGALRIFFGLAAGALSMFWGKGYVRTLVNSVVQGAVAGGACGVLNLVFAFAGVAAASVAFGGQDVVSALLSSQRALITDTLIIFICGMVGAIACAPMIVRIR